MNVLVFKFGLLASKCSQYLFCHKNKSTRAYVEFMYRSFFLDLFGLVFAESVLQ